jgi:PqqD family protein of HPr-rel-A system
MGNVKPRARPTVAFSMVGQEGVAFDSADGSLHKLNPSAALVYRVCDGSATIDELAVDVADAFEVPFSDVHPQIEALVESLATLGLVEDASLDGQRARESTILLDGRAAVRKEVPRST